MQDKIYACWLGKNIGGTLGGPFEGKRTKLDVKGFTTPPGKPLPNDDLDLQLVWLKAVEENGRYKLDERLLGEYWMEYVSPYWNEYGVGKGNMAAGLVPPISGEYDNEWKHSNGAWIRTEVWACLDPALVEDTMRFGYMDACVDHGMGEGTYATIFIAAIESAAFAISDMRELIRIGLSKIPKSCRTHKFVSHVIKCYDNGNSWDTARDEVTEMAMNEPDFGTNDGWFQAPTNVAYTVIGLLYGEGDFKKTLLTAINCGDDTDCTGATAGAIMGLIYGQKIIPEDWKAYIGDEIVTVAINRGACYGIPLSCTELASKLLMLQPEMLRGKNVSITDGDDELPENDIQAFYGDSFARALEARSSYCCDYDFTPASVHIDYERAPEIKENESISFTATVTNHFLSQRHFECELLLPDGWTYSCEKKNLYIKNRPNSASAVFTITAGAVKSRNDAVLRIITPGRPETILVPLTFLG